MTKAHLVHYGVPDKFLSNNGPKYISQESVNFSKEYVFKMITRSSYYARVTGKAESCIKEAEKMLSDLLTRLLDHQNTPPQDMTYSPAKRFLCRRTKSTLPMSATLLGQSMLPVAGVQDEHLGRWAKAKTYYDKPAYRVLVGLWRGLGRGYSLLVCHYDTEWIT